MIVLLLSTSLASAITIYVPGDYPTIGEAVNAAVDGDSIVVGPGEYEGVRVIGTPNDITLTGSGAFCADPTILLPDPTHYANLMLQYLSGWTVKDLVLYQPDSYQYTSEGLNLGWCDDILIDGVYIKEVHDPSAHGLNIWYCSNVDVYYSLITAGNYDVIRVEGGYNLSLRNLTVSGNSNGICVRTSVMGNLVIENCIVAFNDGDGIEFPSNTWQPEYVVQYNDSYGNGGDGNYTGFTPDPTNISLDPLFLGGTGWEAYQLQQNSPCIDAGNPTSPPDPDGTIADIGCFYYDQGQPGGNVTIDLEPVNPPVIIPPEGGDFDFDCTLACDSSGYILFDGWYDITAPEGQTVSPVLLRENIMLQPLQSIERTLNFYLSAWAQSGTYTLDGYVGEYPDLVYDSDSFTFEKLPYGGLDSGTGWGILTDGEVTETFDLPTEGIPTKVELDISAFPNPFNPVTTLRFSLPASGHATLKVYDLAGRTVATLLDRNLEMGAHSVQFNGSHLASGVYLVQIEHPEGTQVTRILLMK
jgi:parallel beta-helix repeat protein